VIVNWTDPALDDLDGIFEFIARDAPAYAQIFVQQIMDAADRLEVFPRSGRAVPEAKDEDVREVIFQNYRVVYWIVDEARLDITAVMHGSRDLSNPVNQPWEVQ
jgi:addiction module RelE/StbE family toxin